MSVALQIVASGSISVLVKHFDDWWDKFERAGKKNQSHKVGRGVDS